MVARYGFADTVKSVSSNNTVTTSQTPILAIGKVTKVALEEYPEGTNSRNPVALGSVYVDGDVNNPIPPLSATFKETPVVGEYVVTYTMTASPHSTGVNPVTRTYYLGVINLHTSSNHNAFLNPGDDVEFDIETIVNQLTQNEGDILVEGRHGNSIRFTNTDNTPDILIRNGQEESTDPLAIISEDIQTDGGSIYMTSTKQVELEPNTKDYKSYTEAPTKVNQYNQNQIVLNSGRLVMNSNMDSTLISSAKSINLNTPGSVNVDTNKFVVQSNEILLGDKGATEPLLKGDATVALLNSVITQMISVVTALTTAVGVPPGVPMANISTPASQALAKLNTELTKLETLKSTVSKTK